jgi:fumarylacetoacetase
MIDETHAPDLKSWVESANYPDSDFPVQNLPFGVFKRAGSRELPRGGVAIGDKILDLAALNVTTGPTLNGLAAEGRQYWKKLRKELSRILSSKDDQRRVSHYLVPMVDAELLLPLFIGDYSDFFAGVHHATNVGRLVGLEKPLLPNYKWVPVAYHGRASSIVVSGTPIKRPKGQLKDPNEACPVFAASRRLDYEAELGFVIGPGNALGKPIRIGNALDHVFGIVLLNDWSARDINAWEFQPLGPFLGKSFASTISPWVITLEALAPYTAPALVRPPDDPKPLPHLYDELDQRQGGYSIEIEMLLRSRVMREKKAAPMRLSRSTFLDSYWTLRQMVTHHASNGCNLQPGDLLGSGTMSGTTPDSFGSLLELSEAGRNQVRLPTGEARTFLEDDDEVIQRARCTHRDYVSIGFGEASGLVAPAL